MEFGRAVSGVQLPNVLQKIQYLQAQPAAPQVPAPEPVRPAARTMSADASGPTHPLLGVSTAILETQEFFNAVVFISTGIFLLFVADAFAQVGRRQARLDAMGELLRHNLAR